MKSPITLLLPFIFYLLPSSLLLSCSDEDSASYPPLTYGFVEAHTGRATHVERIVTDGGRAYAISQQIEAGVADTTLRCVAGYTVSSDSTTATLYSIRHIPSDTPLPPDAFTALPKAPVSIESWWQGGNYINIIAGVLTTGQGTHEYAFCENTPTANTDGTVTANVSLLHLRPADDPESYTEKVYMSIPLHKYRNRCDSISLTVNTYEGERTKTFKINN